MENKKDTDLGDNEPLSVLKLFYNCCYFTFLVPFCVKWDREQRFYRLSTHAFQTVNSKLTFFSFQNLMCILNTLCFNFSAHMCRFSCIAVWIRCSITSQHVQRDNRWEHESRLIFCQHNFQFYLSHSHPYFLLSIYQGRLVSSTWGSPNGKCVSSERAIKK